MHCWNKTLANGTASTVPFGVLKQDHYHMAKRPPPPEVMEELKWRGPAAIPNPLIDGSLFLFVVVNANYFIDISK